MMLRQAAFITLGVNALTFGCGESPSETDEIVDNLAQAGYPADDIQVVGDAVYVGRDARVTLAASREMLESDGSTHEHYRTTKLLSYSIKKICIDVPGFTGQFSTAVDLAINNYNEQNLHFTLARAPSSGCQATITGILTAGAGGASGFPDSGLPFPSFSLGIETAARGLDVLEHVITHEIGHTIGLRHSDWYDRTISCGRLGGFEDDLDGAIHIPGTPAQASPTGSIMNSCYWYESTGEFSNSDITALKVLAPSPAPGKPVVCSVFNDGGPVSDRLDAIYYNAPGSLCVPGGSQGTCGKWFGNCVVPGEGTRVTFSVFNDGYADQTEQTTEVYALANRQACIADGTSTGTCRQWFGLPRAVDGREVECFLFDDSYTNMIGPTTSMFFREPGKICMPNGQDGSCRRWFGRCQIRQPRW